MICTHIELTLETTQPRDVAKAMLKFWHYQAEQARQQHSAAVSKVEACGRANRQAEQEWRDSDLGGGFGFGPELPFSEQEIKHHKDKLPKLEAHLKEAKAMAGYMVNYITDKAHPESSQPLPASTTRKSGVPNRQQVYEILKARSLQIQSGSLE